MNFAEMLERQQDEKARGIWFNSKTDRYAWMSNFHACQVPVNVGGKVWFFPNVEAAYQFAKLPPEQRTEPQIKSWLLLTGVQAKYKGKTITLRKDWTEEKKIQIMCFLVVRKFDHNKLLASKLMATNDVKLIHLSPWDKFWGCDEEGNGANALGEMLMKIREDL